MTELNFLYSGVWAEPLAISQASLDRVLVERMSIDPNDESNAHLLDRGQLGSTLLDYLLNCWGRLEEIRLQTSRAKVTFGRTDKVLFMWNLYTRPTTPIP